MKKHSIFIKILIATVIAIPIMIYILSENMDRGFLETLYENTIERLGLSQSTVVQTSIAKEKRAAGPYSPPLGGEYVWGSFTELFSDWHLPYTVTQEQYGTGPMFDPGSPLVGFCCHLGWPVIKSAKSEYLEEIDPMGDDNEYPSWASGNRMALANRDGHKQRIECTIQGELSNVSKAIAYAVSGLNGQYSNCDVQNLVWNSYIWEPYGATHVLDGSTANASHIDTIGGATLHYQDGLGNIARLCRAQQFATWSYQVLGDDGIFDIELTPKKELEEEKDGNKELHIEADQATLSYLIGPYQLDLVTSEGGDVINDEITAAGEGKQTLGDFVYKEITMQNFSETSDNIFVQTRFILHAEYTDGETTEDVEVRREADGSIAKQEETAKAIERIVITDENGVALEYGIPEFGKEFYIRYYLTPELAKDKTLKYLQPEIKTHYLDNGMSAGGTKAQSSKVLYSIHFSLCNEIDDAVNSYVFAKGYDNMDLGDSLDGGLLKEAFFYSSNKGKTANLQDGIEAMEKMVSNSNQHGTGKITWYDDGRGWDGIEDHYGTDEYDMCDGVFLDECDYSSYGYDHKNFFFACEYNTIDEWLSALLKNRKCKVEATAINEGGESVYQVGKTKYLKEPENKIIFRINDDEGFTFTNCGCDKNPCPGQNSNKVCCGNDACDSCSCYHEAVPPVPPDPETGLGGSPGSPEIPCSCGCSCKYAYDSVHIVCDVAKYYRELSHTSPLEAQIIKKIAPDTIEFDMPGSGFSFDTASEAADACEVAISNYVEKYYLEEADKLFELWYRAHAFPCIYVPAGGEAREPTLPFVEEDQTGMQKVFFNVHLESPSQWRDKEYKLTKKEINEYLGGNVSENEKGINSDEDYQVKNVWQGSGIEVTLIDCGVFAASNPPTPPTQPTYDPQEPEPPDPPTEPVKPVEPAIYILVGPPPPPSPELPDPTDSVIQVDPDCAIFGMINCLRIAGFPGLDGEEAFESVKQWFIEQEALDPVNYGGYYPNPSRAKCIEFANWFTSQYAPEGTSRVTIEAVGNNTTGTSFVNRDMILKYLPNTDESGSPVYEEGKEYGSISVHYNVTGDNPINDDGSHYVALSKYRENADGSIDVYVLNSKEGHPSGWVSLDVLTAHQDAQNNYNPNNVWDYGPIIVHYEVGNFVGDEQYPAKYAEWQENYAAWTANYSAYNEAYCAYADAVNAYNEAVRQYNNNPTEEGLNALTPLYEAIQTKETALNTAAENWQNGPKGEKCSEEEDFKFETVSPKPPSISLIKDKYQNYSSNYTDIYNQWDQLKNQFDIDQQEYEEKVEEYNTLVTQNEEAEQQYQQAMIDYNNAYNQYLVDLDNWRNEIATGEVTAPKVVQTTVTDKNGNYGFQRLNPLHRYKLQFRYDGLEYIADLNNPIKDTDVTDISDDIKNRMTAYELDKDIPDIQDDKRINLQGREEVNDVFKDIDASNTNYTGYNGPNKAYGWYTKLRANDASFITYADYKLDNIETDGWTKDDNNIGAFRFVDAYDRFKQDALLVRKESGLLDIDSSSIQKIVETYDDIEKAQDVTYEKVIYEKLRQDLSGRMGTSVSEKNIEHSDKVGDPYDEALQVCNFIYDSLVTSETKHKFPDDAPKKFFLEDVGTSSVADSDGNNRYDNNADVHSEYNHIVADDPFPINVGTDLRTINGLYTKLTSGDDATIRNRDQARNVDYTFKRRPKANLAIAMDLEAVTILINGQRETYKYGDLDINTDNIKDYAMISNRASTDGKYNLLNYNKSYSRVITESMYLYDGDFVDEDNGQIRDLRMFITYKIAIKNIGEVDLDVGKIVNHYDSYYLQWKGEDQDGIKAIVDNPDYFTAVVTENDDGRHTYNPGHYYDSDKKQLAAGNIDNMYNELFIDVGYLGQNDYKEMTLTYEQTKDNYGRLNITQDLSTGALLVGDKNVVEIDGYSTSNNDIFTKGLITQLSNIGNLCPKDFYDLNSADKRKAGGLIDDVLNPDTNRVEIDTACAPNLIIYIPSKGYIPCISGYTFEDVRTEKKDMAVVGNGKYNTDDKDFKKYNDNNDFDKKIQGVTVQLVELVREVDSNGLTLEGTDNYIKEKIWGTTQYTLRDEGQDYRRATENQTMLPNDTVSEEDVHRYYSGTDKAQVILDVDTGYLHIDESKEDETNTPYTKLTKDEGMYKFVNVPPGIFVVRFIYGDTTQTVLVKGDDTNEVNELIPNTTIATVDKNAVINYKDPTDANYMFLPEGTNDSTGFVSYEGLNEKSYNGNDYKSTVYQAELDQNTSYKGVNGYTDYEIQNFTNNDGINMTQITDSDLLSKLYYYDIKIADDAEKDDHKDSVSDAKDIYSFRQNSDNYAKGYINSLTGDLKQDHKTANDVALTAGNGTSGNPITLRNYRNEIMNSFEQLATYTARNDKPEEVNDNLVKLNSSEHADRQVKMLKELMKYTRMVAQTGIINFEIEYTVNDWAHDHESDGESTYISVEMINSENPDKLLLPGDDYTRYEREKNYHIRDLNLGLVERPEAQIRLNKNVSNVKISLSSGETLFDTSKSVNNLYFAYHKAHTYKFNGQRLQSVKVTTNSLNTPELIQAYMDDELIENATLDVKYVFTVENIGEVDYLDKQFYYKGETSDTSLANISRTDVNEVLDYVSNSFNFNATVSNTLDELRGQNVSKTILSQEYQKTNWQVKKIIPSSTDGMLDNISYYANYIYPFGVTTKDAQREQTPIGETVIDASALSTTYLHGNNDSSSTGASSGNLNADLVNREYFDRVYSYAIGSIITTDRLSTKKYSPLYYYSAQMNNMNSGNNIYYSYGLLPKVLEPKNEYDYKIETQLQLSVVMSENEDLVFPNLVEAVRISNSVGRRCTYSTVGNQPMANQNYGSDISSEEKTDTLLDKYSIYSPVDVVTPIEIDADSSQSVRILPPTGFNKNNLNLYFALIGAFSIIVVSIFMIKISLGQRRRKKKADISRWM